jgi:energy-coupling factor transport system permease protein
MQREIGGLIELVYRLGPLMVSVTIHAIIGSEDNIDAMDLRTFGVGPCTWLEELHYRWRDRVLIAIGILILVASFAMQVIGLGEFWIPEALLRLSGG